MLLLTDIESDPHNQQAVALRRTLTQWGIDSSKATQSKKIQSTKTKGY